MQTTKTNIAAWIQAGTSALFIVCAFLPCVQVYYEIEGRGITFYQMYEGIFLCTLLHIANIFIQAHGSCRFFSTILSATCLILLAISCIGIEETLFTNNHMVNEYEYGIPFYIMILILLVQLIVPTLVLKYESKPVTDAVEAEIAEKKEEPQN